MRLIAFPVTFYVANLASALPALFPTSSRYGGMGIAYNFSVAIFGGTTPFIVAGLDPGHRQRHDAGVLPHGHVNRWCDRHLLPARIRPAPAAGLHAQRGHPAEARELVATQDTNPLINLDEMPFDGRPIDDSAFGNGNKDLAST